MELSVHSDILIHWTGRDIEERPVTQLNKDTFYLERLRNCLKYGLWMKKANNPESIQVNNMRIDIPSIARTCFTELKLSMSEDHARLYGRMGIGVKRYFLFDRLGAPVNYYQADTFNHFFPPYSEALTRDNPTSEILSFFKPMCSGRPLKYDIFNESEWRIIYSERIEKKLIDHENGERARLFINPQSTKDAEIRDYYLSLDTDNRPDYLIPLDPWLAIIIYPSLRVKMNSIASVEIRSLLREVSKRTTVTGCPERGCMPIEIDLFACKHM